jgi:carbamate kinase
MHMETDPVVVALGGNTLLGEHGTGTINEQLEVIQRTARRVSDAIDAGYDIVLTHGNGPQVGDRLLQQENSSETPQFPLDVLVAETQAQIGYLLQQALDNEVSTPTDFITVVTQVVVDADDPAFQNPTKPVGPFYTESEAEDRSFETRRVTGGSRPYRRVVASPDPVDIVEDDEISGLVDRGGFVICVGGGGVPVVRSDGLCGVEAVVDKDKSSQLLASRLDADTLIILTDVEYAYLNYGTPEQKPLTETTVEELRMHLEADEFATGSMQPKIVACIRFVEREGEKAVITSPDHLLDALSGDAGTRVK